MILDIIGIGAKLIDKVIPDPTAKAEAKLKLLELQQAGEFKLLDADLQIALAQTGVNAVEAADVRAHEKVRNFGHGSSRCPRPGLSTRSS